MESSCCECPVTILHVQAVQIDRKGWVGFSWRHCPLHYRFVGSPSFPRFVPKIILIRMAEKTSFLIRCGGYVCWPWSFLSAFNQGKFHSSCMSIAKFHNYVCACMLSSCFVVILFVWWSKLNFSRSCTLIFHTINLFPFWPFIFILLTRADCIHHNYLS